MMLERPPPTPGAARARNSRARRKQGVRTFRVRAHERRLVAALRRANPSLPAELSLELIGSELEAIVAAGRARRRERQRV
jgi:hypothetical protein